MQCWQMPRPVFARDDVALKFRAHHTVRPGHRSVSASAPADAPPTERLMSMGIGFRVHHVQMGQLLRATIKERWWRCRAKWRFQTCLCPSVEAAIWSLKCELRVPARGQGGGNKSCWRSSDKIFPAEMPSLSARCKAAKYAVFGVSIATHSVLRAGGPRNHIMAHAATRQSTNANAAFS